MNLPPQPSGSNRKAADTVAEEQDGWVPAQKCDGQLCYYHGCQHLPECALPAKLGRP